MLEITIYRRDETTETHQRKEGKANVVTASVDRWCREQSARAEVKSVGVSAWGGCWRRGYSDGRAGITSIVSPDIRARELREERGYGG